MTTDTVRAQLLAACQNLSTLARSDWGPAFKQVATVMLVATYCTYRAGLALGKWVHTANSKLSAGYKVALGLPVALPAIRYEDWTCNDLRELLGGFKKKALKRDLVAMAYGQVA